MARFGTVDVIVPCTTQCWSIIAANWLEIHVEPLHKIWSSYFSLITFDMDEMVWFVVDSNVFIAIKVCISCGLDWEKEWKGKDFDGENMTFYSIAIRDQLLEDMFGSFIFWSSTLVTLFLSGIWIQFSFGVS